jgi:hypothetical protein
MVNTRGSRSLDHAATPSARRRPVRAEERAQLLRVELGLLERHEVPAARSTIVSGIGLLSQKIERRHWWPGSCRRGERARSSASRLAERPVGLPAAVGRVAGALSRLPGGAAVRVGGPGRKGNAIGVSG